MKKLIDKFKELQQPKDSITLTRSYGLERWRFMLVWLLVVLCLLALVLRTLYVQIINQEYYQKKAHAKMLVREKTKPVRGMIMDRNGVPLAISSPVMTVTIDPYFYNEQKTIYDNAVATLAQDPKNPEAYRKKKELAHYSFDLKPVAEILGLDTKSLQDKMEEFKNSGKKRRYFVLKKEVSPQDADKIRSLRVLGILTEENYKRYYPQAQPNAQIVGMTSEDGTGIEGLEKQLNKRLEGQGSEQIILLDKQRNPLKVQKVIKEEEAGENIQLSIDARLQYFMYRELMRAGIERQANYASAVAIDIKTGEILAMNTWPSYNPNAKESATQHDERRNRGAVDQFEPGSTMKPFTIAMGLSTDKYTPNSLIDTSPGTMQLGQSIIRDQHNYGSLSLTNIIVKSSNVGVAKIALAEPLSSLPTFYRKLGFGEKTAVNFIGESAGKIHKEANWTRPLIGTMSYGYGLDVTMLQLAQAYAILGNRGIKLPLSIYKVEKTPEGEEIIHPTIAEQVVLMMEKATHEGGTAMKANVNGYRVAGKTGTAHKIDTKTKRYVKEYRALFAGVAPVSDPRIALVVVVDNPQGQYFGGLVAAPIFSNIMQETLRLMNIPSDKALTKTS